MPSPPEAIGWKSVCALLESLERTREKKLRAAKLQKFWAWAERTAGRPFADGETAVLLRLLHPLADSRRYYLKERSLSRAVHPWIDVARRRRGAPRLARGRRGGRRQRRRRRRRRRDVGPARRLHVDGEGAGRSVGRHPEHDRRARKFALRRRGAARSTSPTSTARSFCSRAATARAADDRAAGRDVLRALLSRCTGVEAKWSMRVRLRDLRISGCGEQRDAYSGAWPRLIFDSFSEGLYVAYSWRGDLAAAAMAAEAARARARRRRVGRRHAHDRQWAHRRRVRGADAGGGPARASRRCAPSSATILCSRWKYDGERLQVHATASEQRRRDAARLQARRKRVLVRPARRRQPGAAPPPSATRRPPRRARRRRSPPRCTLRSAAAAAAPPSARVPAAARALDRARRRAADLQRDAVRRRRRHRALRRRPTLVHSDRGGRQRHRSSLGGRRRHLFIFFDVLHLDGRDLTPLPLHARVAALRGALREIDTFVVTSRARRMAYDEGALTAAFARSRAERYEGLVVKAAASPYVPNERRHWCKLKHDRIPGLGDTVTLAIVGARLGDGGALGELCLGCRDGDGERRCRRRRPSLGAGCATSAVRTADSPSRCGSILMVPSSASALAARRAPCSCRSAAAALRRRGSVTRQRRRRCARMRSSRRQRRRSSRIVSARSSYRRTPPTPPAPRRLDAPVPSDAGAAAADGAARAVRER